MTTRLWKLASTLAITLTACMNIGAVRAQTNFPDRPIRLVVPYAAGGPTDTFARALAASWGRKLNTSVVVENRSGAGTIVGTELTAKASPDGYTLLLTTVAHAVNPAIHARLPYRTVDDFAPVGPVGVGREQGGAGQNASGIH